MTKEFEQEVKKTGTTSTRSTKILTVTRRLRVMKPKALTNFIVKIQGQATCLIFGVGQLEMRECVI